MDDNKLGVDDYLAQGHTLDDLLGLEVISQEIPGRTLREKSHEIYCIEAGRLCWVKQTSDGLTEVPLCNFTAKVTEDILKDNGLENNRVFKTTGKLGNGQELPPIEVPSANFNSLGWVVSEWGMQAVIAAGQSSKDRLREAIQLQSQDAQQRVVYVHTGWRDIDGDLTFLSGAGGLGIQKVEVELESTLQKYALPDPEGDPVEAIKASFNFHFVADLEITLPLWASMYLAPLSEILNPAFTLWLVGPSGAFKSTLAALALSHFGAFDDKSLPSSWRDTRNQLEKLLFLAKDVPLVIDDWAPGQDSAKAREMEVKAEYIIRAQGNRQGRGRMRSDTSSRPSYIPRGLLITSGEQLPSGHSHTARIYSLQVERADVDREYLTIAQDEKHLYPVAMSHFILWLKDRWPKLSKELPAHWRILRDRARKEDAHPRLPEVIAYLQSALELAAEFAMEKGAINEADAKALSQNGWDIFCKLASSQAHRIEEERPGKRFIEALRAIIDQGKAVLWNIDDEEPRTAIPGTTAIGWYDNDGYILLNPQAAYAAVHEFCQRAGEPMTFKKDAVWQDLNRLSYLDCQNGRATKLVRLYGRPMRIIKLKRKLTPEMEL